MKPLGVVLGNPGEQVGVPPVIDTWLREGQAEELESQQMLSFWRGQLEEPA